jgi:hypothetical protein
MWLYKSKIVVTQEKCLNFTKESYKRLKINARLSKIDSI